MVGEVAEVVAPEEDSPLRMGWDNWYYDISVVGGLGLDEDGQLAVAVMCKVRRGDLGSGGAGVWAMAHEALGWFVVAGNSPHCASCVLALPLPARAHRACTPAPGTTCT